MCIGLVLACAAGWLWAPLLAPTAGRGNAYTLYRSSVFDKAARIHIVTFDATEAASYNQENCRAAEKLFSRQEAVSVTYWCEKGIYRP